MPRWSEAPIVGGCYSDDTMPFSAQDTVNYMVVYTEKNGTRSPSLLRGCPGFYDIADTGSGSPIRGMHNAEGLLLVVSGNKLYRVDPKFTCTEIGTIPGVGRVSIDHNQVAGGNQVAIANGSSGYVYDTRDGSLVQITDDGFPGSIAFAFADGYILGIAPNRRRAFTSDLADALSYSTLDQYEAESSPDALVGQGVSHSEWWLFGERTTEIWANTGAETGTWQRTSGTVIEVGAASSFAICNLDNSIFWLGSDGIVYRADGLLPKRISTFPVEQAIARCTLGSAFAFTFEDRGHKVFYLTLLDGHTWGYDVASQEWHRRESFGLDRWRLNDLVKWNGMWIGGDYLNGKLYRLDWDVQSEADQPLERLRVTGVLADAQNAVIVNALELVIDTGLPSIPSSFRITGDVGNGQSETTVDMTYHSINGAAPYKYSIASGSLPTGLSMDVTGHVTGTRTDAGIYTWTVQAIDANGIRAQLVDSSITYDAPPVYTGTFEILAVAGSNSDSVSSIIPKGAWKLLIADMDIENQMVSLYVDNEFIGSNLVPEFVRPFRDLVVGGVDYTDPAFNAFRGLLWGAGVFNGAMSQDDRDALWNGGDGTTFADLANDHPDTFASLAYAWQLADASTAVELAASKGGVPLTVEPEGARATVIDAKFGRVTFLSAMGRLRALGTEAGTAESSTHVSYFAWAYSGVLETDQFPSIISRYNGISDPYMGLRSFWVSD